MAPGPARKRKPSATIVETAPIVLDKVVKAESAIEPGKGRGPAPRRRVTGRLIRGSELPSEFELERLPELVGDNSNLAWVDLSEYSAEDLAAVAKILALHPLTIEAALDSWQRPRLDSFEDHFYLSATVASANSKLLTITAGELQRFDAVLDQLARVGKP